MKPPLTWLKIVPVTVSFFCEGFLEAHPALLAARLLAREHRLAERVLDALQVDFDLVAGIQHPVRPRTPNSLSGTRPSTFRPTSMTATSFSIATTRALDDGAFGEVADAEGLFQKGREILAGRILLRLNCWH